ncbi:hypothetical protein IAR55_006359 [Kwoniella newhampshirensis]|uniref:Carboxypeptidase n=1 Tax=Kwoniella newhampshirensis TaxID=1651941 RepID=A0AAW0YY44_9TREE
MLLSYLVPAALFGLTALARQRTFTTTSQAESVHTLSSSIPPPDHPDGSSFTTFKHTSFPGHGIRIKHVEKGWCEKNAATYTGYIDVDGYGESLFFYFFESRDKPAEDDVIFWINGGPGASSALGLFMELGPCRITPENGNSLVDNPDSWNNHANIFFLDEPSGVGFSFNENGQLLHTRTEQAAVDVGNFVQMWFETFSEFKGRKFHMAGESYGGRYLPLFASAVLDGNMYAEARNVTPVNLQSVMIGNGWTDTVTMMEGHVEQQCSSESGVKAIQSIGTCVALYEALPLCLEMLEKDCRHRFDDRRCGLAVDYCEGTIIGAFRKTGRNWYDISEKCEAGVCYPQALSNALDEYLNRNSTLKTLGIDPHWTGPWVSSSAGVAASMGGIASSPSMDLHHKTYLYVAGLLERGVRVLVYAGKVDFACNFIGVRKWVERLSWSGSKAYVASEERPWYLPGSKDIAGEVRTGGNGLTFATVRGAGHLVPLRKPKEAEHMLMKWIRDEEF